MKKTALVAALMLSTQAFAQEAAHVATTTAVGAAEKGWYSIAIAILLGLAAFGATTGQSKVGAAAMEGMARNPQARNAMFVPMIVILALIESLFILTWLIGFLLNGKI